MVYFFVRQKRRLLLSYGAWDTRSFFLTLGQVSKVNIFDETNSIREKVGSDDRLKAAEKVK